MGACCKSVDNTLPDSSGYYKLPEFQPIQQYPKQSALQLLKSFEMFQLFLQKQNNSFPEAVAIIKWELLFALQTATKIAGNQKEWRKFIKHDQALQKAINYFQDINQQNSDQAFSFPMHEQWEHIRNSYQKGCNIKRVELDDNEGNTSVILDDDEGNTSVILDDVESNTSVILDDVESNTTFKLVKNKLHVFFDEIFRYLQKQIKELKDPK